MNDHARDVLRQAALQGVRQIMYANDELGWDFLTIACKVGVEVEVEAV